MPLKDREARLAYQREWYSRPGNRELTIKKVGDYKKRALRGVCKNCGGPTQGMSYATIPEWCGKPECKSAHYRTMSEVFSEASKRGHAKSKASRRRKMLRENKVLTIAELSKLY